LLHGGDDLCGHEVVEDQGHRDTQTPEQDRQSLYDPHMVRKLSTYVLVLLIMNVFPITRPGCLRLRVRKVAAMRHRRDVFDVLSLIDQSTVDLSVFDTSVCAVSRSQVEPLGGGWVTWWIRS
jgi:hypothetical protein